MTKKIFITGSSDGIGLIAAKKLINDGHKLYLHARHEERAKELRSKVSGFEDILIGDLTKPNEILSLVEGLNKIGAMDSIIHNAGVIGNDGPEYNEYEMSSIFSVNVFAPYLLSKLMHTPERLIYISSDLHYHESDNLTDYQFKQREWNSRQAYNDSKLFVTMLMHYFSEKLPNSYVNAVDPGWVPTKMGGKSASDDLDEGAQTQAWLASSEKEDAKISGKYFHHMEQREPNAKVFDISMVSDLITYLNKKEKL